MYNFACTGVLRIEANLVPLTRSHRCFRRSPSLPLPMELTSVEGGAIVHVALETPDLRDPRDRVERGAPRMLMSERGLGRVDAGAPTEMRIWLRCTDSDDLRGPTVTVAQEVQMLAVLSPANQKSLPGTKVILAARGVAEVTFCFVRPQGGLPPGAEKAVASASKALAVFPAEPTPVLSRIAPGDAAVPSSSSNPVGEE